MSLLNIIEDIFLFADDTTITVSSSNLNTSIEKLNEVFKKLELWMQQNQMQLNKSKTKIIIHRSNNKNQLIIDSLETVDSTKLLGVLISDDLKWKNHIDITCKKIIPYCYALNKTNKVLNIPTLKSIYYAHIFSHLKYSIVSWGSSPHAKKLFQIQKWAVRSIVGVKKSTSCKPIFKKLKILPLPCIFIYECACFIRKHFQTFQLNGECHEYSTRSKDEPRIPSHKTNHFKYSPHYSCIKIYQNLPEKILTLPDDSFNSKLKNYLLEQLFYDLKDFLN